ncbi:putative endonuclease [Algoriella xinjiangensis]|uniref:Putative endonuclease n=1 Tax=Algoriella xinjiangensis TaxID=684065 RepID=A0A1I4UD51_9FLAO|nr:GIY-YIG nuclease family protein [Algoriella xinjiangensis]SFM86914.1 putative endonuclease [Algoriella xinjiangensis]VDH17983.1 GIY-YIG nuclease superfamily protein [Algoriella xinjiangensis]
MNLYYVYILTNKYRTVFYIGVTNNLSKRIIEHKENNGSIFTKKYNVHSLIYFEEFSSIHEAIAREKQLKNWKREWKINLIKQFNPTLKDINIFE